MGTPYSLDLRRRVLEAYDAGEGSIREVSERFAVNKDTVCEWLRLRRETGELTHRPMGGVRGRKVGPKERNALCGLVGDQNDRTQQQMAEALFEERGVRVHRSTIGRLLGEIGITRKKSRSARKRPARPGGGRCAVGSSAARSR